MDPNQPILDSQELFDEPLPTVPTVERGHPPALWALLGIKGLERLGFYGFRVLFTLFLVREFGQAQGQSMVYYTAFTSLIYLFSLLGGLLGDRGLGHKRALAVGSGLAITGVIFLLISDPSLRYVGFGLLVLGTSLFNPNGLAIFALHYQNRKASMDAGFLFYHFAVNIGAMVASAGIAYFSEIFGIPFGLVLVALAYLACLGLILITFKQLEPPPAHPVFNRPRMLPLAHLGKVLALVLFGNMILFVFLEGTYSQLFDLAYSVQWDFRLSFVLVIQNVPFMIMAVCVPLFAAYFLRKKQSPLFRLGCSYLICALAAVCLLVLPAAWGWLFLVNVLLTIGDALLAPMLYSFIGQNTARKHMGSAMSILLFTFALPHLLNNKIADLALGANTLQLGFPAGLLLMGIVLGGVFIYLGVKWQQSGEQ